MGNYRRYGGVSRQVQKTTLNAFPGHSPLAELTRVTTVLGFKGKTAEREKVHERVQQQYAGEKIIRKCNNHLTWLLVY